MKGRYIQRLEHQRAGLLNEKAAVEVELAALNREISDYQQRVENTPKREQEFITLQRDYDNLNALYKSLLDRKLEAEMSVTMERKQKGGQFQIIDRARLPFKPFKPNLIIMIILSIAMGFGLGAGLIFLVEHFSNSYRNPEEIESVLKVPVIAAVPRVMTPKDIFFKRAEATLCSLVALLTIAAIGVFAFVSLNGTDQAIEALRGFLNA